MGKFNEFSITLSSPQPVFYPGQSVVGYVTVDLSQPMEMRGIKLKLKGKGYCHWTEQHTVGSGENQHTETRHYTGKETLVNISQMLFGDGHTKTTHSAGRQMYQFNFTLPSSLPSSFEAHLGYIRYLLKANVDRPWKFDHKVKRPFSINDVIDTNNPMYAEGVGGESHKEPGCLCCKAGLVDMTAGIDRRCYCPGEAIFINSSIQNQSTRDLDSMHAKLIQTITYHATTKSRTEQREIGRLAGPMIPKGEEAKWFNQPFGIPACAPTIINSRVITVHYKLKVVAAIPCAIDATVKMHITMGTVPYVKMYGQQVQYGGPEVPQQLPESNFIGGLAYPPAPPAFLGHPDIPPPSYSAAVGQSGVNIAGSKDQHTFGDLSYNPVYTFAQPYQGTFDWANNPNLAQPPPYNPAVGPNPNVEPYLPNVEPYNQNVEPYNPDVKAYPPGEPYNSAVPPVEPYNPAAPPPVQPYNPAAPHVQPYNPAGPPVQPYNPAGPPMEPYNPAGPPMEPYNPAGPPVEQYNPPGETYKPPVA